MLEKLPRRQAADPEEDKDHKEKGDQEEAQDLDDDGESQHPFLFSF